MPDQSLNFMTNYHALAQMRMLAHMPCMIYVCDRLSPPHTYSIPALISMMSGPVGISMLALE